jgi:hypothetical protein
MHFFFRVRELVFVMKISSAIVTKEGGHISKLSLFLDITFVRFFSAKIKWVERGRERKKAS